MRLTATATCCCSARKRGACPRNSSTASEEGSCLRIPMLPDSRSLNLSNAAALVTYEALRQLGFPGLS
jgi:tRNA(Leu) C34 or U34 (ribose-2'-O)-methylase TrmL